MNSEKKKRALEFRKPKRNVSCASLWSVALLMLAMAASSGSQTSGDSLVDLNRASVTDLMRVPGMTVVWANRIIRFRPYRSKLDLLEQGVVTPEVYQRIRDGVIAHRVSPTETGAAIPH